MPDKPTVIVDPSFRRMDEIFSDADKQRLHSLANVVWGKDEPMPYDQFRAALPDAEAIICADWSRYRNEDLRNAPKLRALVTVGGGFPDGLDYDYCFSRNIRVLSVAPAFARQVAEMALAMALDLCRDLSAGDRAFRAGQEQWLWAGNVGTYMMYGKSVGFIGYGSIARTLQPLLQPFGVTISAYDPWLGEGFLQRHGVTPVALETLLRESRFIFVLAAPTAENRAFLSREYLEMIQPGAVFVLISRAHVVDFDALTDLVLAKRFKAGIDVFPREPFDTDHPIRTAENVVLSAHRAGSVEEGLWEIGEMALDDLEAILRGLPPQQMLRAEPELVKRYSAVLIRPDEEEE